MIWGDTKAFAIEAHVDPGQIYGHFAIWVAGQRFGDMEDAADLASGARWGRLFLQSSPRRNRPDLEARSPEQCVRELFERYVEFDTSPWDRAAFLLDGAGDSSLRDRASVLVFRGADDRDRVTARGWKSGSTLQAVVAPGVVDDVVGQFCAWVEALPRSGS
jgi:hypothetical protein